MAFTVFDPLLQPLTALVQALLAPEAGLVVDPASITLQRSGPGAVSLYDAAVGAPLGIDAGVLLSSGIAPGTSNTLSWYGADNSGSTGFTNGDAAIDAVVNAVFQTQSYDATSLSFAFSVTDPQATSISFDLLFGSDEYPEWVDAFVDCGVVMVDGVNDALFNNDPLHPLSVISPNLAAGYFRDNSAGLLPIEYDGVSGRLRIVAPLKAGQSTHTIKIAIADTGDHILDSGLFIANLSAGRDPGSGVVANPGGGTSGNDTCTGSAKDEYFDLQAGDDTVYAGGGADIVVAGAGNDTVFGGTGDDQLRGDGGDDALDGGGDCDTAIYSGVRSAYGLSADPLSGAITVDGRSQGEGLDVLRAVEQLQFSDGLFAFSQPGSASLAPVLPLTPPPPPINHAGEVVLWDAAGQPCEGPVAVGATLVAVIADADGLSGEAQVQWFRDGQEIEGATAVTYTVQGDDANHSLAAKASYSDAGGHLESPSSGSVLVLADGGNGEPVLSLMNVGGPATAAVHTPITTLLMAAIALGETPNGAMQKIRAVLQVPTAVPSLLSTNAFKILQSGVGDSATALALAKLEVQVALVCSTAIVDPLSGALQTDPAGLALTALLLERAANGQTVDLANADDLVALHPQLAGSEALDLLVSRNANIQKAEALLGSGDAIENEWLDFISTWDLTLQDIPLSVLSQAINQGPTGTPTAPLPAAVAGEAVTLPQALLTQGLVDPDGDPLTVSALYTDLGDWFTLAADGSWVLDPHAAGYDPAYSGPLELHYTVDDGHGHSLAASQLLLIQAPNPAPSFALLADTGSSASDGLTNNGTVQVSGLVAGNLWQVSLNGGAWSTGSGSSFTLAAGSYAPGSIAVRQSHAAGVSPSATNAAAITVDLAAPLAPTLALVADTGKSATDRITSNPGFAVGQLEAGASWEVSLNGGASWSAGSGVGFNAPDGTYAAGAIAVRQRDAAGNLGAPRATTASVTIDTQAPVSPSFQLSVDSGISASDQISSNGAVTVSGLLSGHTWQTSSNGGASWSAAQAATTTSFKLAAGSYAPGAVVVRQLDLAGNASPASANSAPIRIDATRPTVTSTLVGGTALVVRFSEPVAFPGASTARFAVLNGSTSVAINGVSVDGAGTSVTLSLASAIASTSQVKLSYSDPTTANDATGALEDLAGNDLASRSATAVPIYLASSSVSLASGFHSGYTGVELTAAAGAASLTGNASANDLTGNDADNVISGGAGADALTGGAGADAFLYASNADSLLGTSSAPRYDRIRDLAIGTDTLTMATAFAAPAGSISHRGTASALSEAAIATLLPTTSFAAGTAAAFSLGSGATTRTFLVLNDGVAGYQAATDGLIEITGFSGSLGALGVL